MTREGKIKRNSIMEYISCEDLKSSKNSENCIYLDAK